MKKRTLIVSILSALVVIGLLVIFVIYSNRSLPRIAPGEVTQVQFNAVKIDAKRMGAKKVETLQNDITNTMRLENQVFFGTHKGNDYFSLLLRNEERKEQYFFFCENSKWYMETKQGKVYEDAEFILNYADLSDDLERASENITITVGETDEEEINNSEEKLRFEQKRMQYAQKHHIAKSEEAYVKEFTKNFDHELYKDVIKQFGERDIEEEEAIQYLAKATYRSYVDNALYNYAYEEFRNGNDEINGTVYMTLNEYYNAYLTEVIYPESESYDVSE